MGSGGWDEATRPSDGQGAAHRAVRRERHRGAGRGARDREPEARETGAAGVSRAPGTALGQRRRARGDPRLPPPGRRGRPRSGEPMPLRDRDPGSVPRGAGSRFRGPGFTVEGPGSEGARERGRPRSGWPRAPRRGGTLGPARWEGHFVGPERLRAFRLGPARWALGPGNGGERIGTAAAGSAVRSDPGIRSGAVGCGCGKRRPGRAVRGGRRRRGGVRRGGPRRGRSRRAGRRRRTV